MKKSLTVLTAIFIVTLLLPFLTVKFSGSSGMVICMILFFVLNPLLSFFCGIFAGNNIKRRWSLPLVSSFSFLMGAWWFFDAGEPAFTGYAAVYLAIGIICMLTTSFFNKKHMRNKK